MISEMEARQMKMYEAMAEVQTTSIAAIQAATASPIPPQRARGYDRACQCSHVEAHWNP